MYMCVTKIWKIWAEIFEKWKRRKIEKWRFGHEGVLEKISDWNLTFFFFLWPTFFKKNRNFSKSENLKFFQKSYFFFKIWKSNSFPKSRYFKNGKCFFLRGMWRKKYLTNLKINQTLFKKSQNLFIFFFLFTFFFFFQNQ